MRRRAFWAALCLAALMSPGIGHAQEPVKDRVQTITGKGQTFLQPDGWFVGKATFLVNGQTVAVTSRALLVSEDLLDDGKTQAVTLHILDFGNGNTIQTLDQALLTPTETPRKLRLQSILKVTRGTGIYKNAIGKLGGPGGFLYLNEAPPRAQWETVGTILLEAAGP